MSLPLLTLLRKSSYVPQFLNLVDHDPLVEGVCTLHRQWTEAVLPRMFVAVTYLFVHELVYYLYARMCAIMRGSNKDALPPAPARYHHTCIGRAEALQRFKRSCRSEAM
jgi:hypothetical protein